MSAIKVFKFGGASVKDAEAVRNVLRILQRFNDERLVVVVSAMGKTTNAMERIVHAYFNNEDWSELLEERKSFHQNILQELFKDDDPVHGVIHENFRLLEELLSDEPSDNFDFEYDQIVSFGEILSTLIVSEYIHRQGIRSQWMDARKLIRTDNLYREGQVNWVKTQVKLQEATLPFLEKPGVAIIQGFLGHTPERFTTTLGREGSDFTAAICAWCLDARDVTIWKDVPGVLNADPKYFENTVKLDSISFSEAIELSYYGATIIHPKTIKPLQNKNIPLYARSFVDPEERGTCISDDVSGDGKVPSFIFKVNQVLIRLTPKDFSFIAEDNMSDIFRRFADSQVPIRLMQNSAIHFSACVDWDDRRIPALLDSLSKNFAVEHDTGVELVTIRHYDAPTIERVTQLKEILVDQRTPVTARMVLRDVTQSL